MKNKEDFSISRVCPALPTTRSLTHLKLQLVHHAPICNNINKQNNMKGKILTLVISTIITATLLSITLFVIYS